jgi:hypothetical protein
VLLKHFLCHSSHKSYFITSWLLVSYSRRVRERYSTPLSCRYTSSTRERTVLPEVEFNLLMQKIDFCDGSFHNTFLISGFRRVLNVVCSLLGCSPACGVLTLSARHPFQNFSTTFILNVNNTGAKQRSIMK